MVLQLQNTDSEMTSPMQSRDAVRSKAWRARQARFLSNLIVASGHIAGEGSVQSYMAQLKTIHAALWKQTLVEIPASVMRHDPSLTRQERRRISSVKNNRLCRTRHSLFLQKIEQELAAKGVPSTGLSALKGLVPA